MKRYCVLGGLGCFLAALLFAFWHLWLFRSESTTVQETPFLFKWRWGRPSHFCVDANGNGYYETWYRQESYGSFSTTASPDEALVDGDEDGVYELHAVWQPTPRVHFRIAIDEDGDGLRETVLDGEQAFALYLDRLKAPLARSSQQASDLPTRCTQHPATVPQDEYTALHG
jgi:hypothetical protein